MGILPSVQTVPQRYLGNSFFNGHLLSAYYEPDGCECALQYVTEYEYKEYKIQPAIPIII